MGIYKRLKEAPADWKPKNKKQCLENIENAIKRNEQLKTVASGEQLSLAEEKLTFLKTKKEEISAL
jgi:flavorubredoxin|tara:strand:- start:6386 stop:6583 length:198 start_codon:yes stop_codon:yes gene_type:complete